MLNPAPLARSLREDHPVWMCAMRPFFVLTALSALLLMGPWALFLIQGWPLVPTAAGGPFVWHGHELLSGFAFASVLGFLLTAGPEFTDTSDFAPRHARRLVALWLLARAAFFACALTGWAALVALSALVHLLLVADLLRLLWPRLWAHAGRAHLSFAWTLLALLVCEAGFHHDLWRSLTDSPAAGEPSRWLYAMLGAYMVLVVVALGRISMRIVNQALQDAGRAADYLARPPRRNLLVVCVAAHTLAQWWMPQARLTGWLALATMAAVWHVLNDWHMAGRCLFTRWVLALYMVYVSMGLGYALMALALLADVGSVSAGRHLLAVGALGLPVLCAMSIAGRAHCGHWPETRLWLVLAVLALVLAAGLRALAGGFWANVGPWAGHWRPCCGALPLPRG